MISNRDLYVRRAVRLLLRAAWSEDYAECRTLMDEAGYWHRLALQDQIAQKQPGP